MQTKYTPILFFLLTCANLCVAERPNLLFISVDDWNDWVGCFVVHDFETPVKISMTPLRTDRLTYSYSNAFDREFQQLFQSNGSTAQ
jgi:hypothetical protein